MYNHAIDTLKADRQRAFMQQADNHRLIATAGPEPRVRRARRLALRIWVAAQQGTYRRRPSSTAPPSIAVGS